MTSIRLATAVIGAALLLPTSSALAQEASPRLGSPLPAASADSSAAPDASAVAEASAAPAVDALLALIPVEAAGLALREGAATFDAEEMRANSGDDELVLLDQLLSSAGDPTEGLGVAAVFATTAEGDGGIMLQAISVPGMLPQDGVTFWASMLDLANEASQTEEVQIADKSVTAYTSPDDPGITAHLYGTDGAAWLIIASDPAMLADLLTQLP